MGKGAKAASGNSRIRAMDAADSGPKKSTVQMKGLAWDTKAAQPAFLKNALAALQGPQAAPSADGGRPAIPQRPEGEEEEEPESEEDEWDMGRGEEAPAVVVLKEGRHLDRDEVDRLRAEAKLGSAPDPLASSSAPANTKNTGSLSFASSSSKRKISEAEGAVPESWEDVIKRSKIATEEKAAAKREQEAEAAKEKEKLERKKKKEKKEQKKKIGKLSFDEE